MAENSQPEEFTKVTETETTVHTVRRSVEKGNASEARSSGHRELLRELPSAILLCVIMSALAIGFDHSSVGEEFSDFVYRVLQGRLTPANESDVTIIDISNLTRESGITPRDKLKRLLQAVDAQRPAVIGVDIDFSPEEHHFVDLRDPLDFFPFCQKLATPVYLGVFRARESSPEQWLGFPTFKSLGAALVVHTTPKKSIWSLSPSLAKSDAKAGHMPEAPSMSSALATTYWSKRQEKRNSRWSVFGEFVELKIADDVVFHEFYIDFSSRKRLIDNAIRIDEQDYKTGLDPIMRSRIKDLRGKVVLLGDVDKPQDPVPDPASGGAIPGVVVHAAAANTLISGPLYAFPEINGFSLDLLVSLGITGLIFGARISYKDSIQEQRLILLANLGGALVIAVFGWGVNWTRVLWPDFLLLSIGLLLHPSAHRCFETTKKGIGQWLRKPTTEIR